MLLNYSLDFKMIPAKERDKIMPQIFRVILLLMVTGLLAACGVKGKLKTPDQIERLEAKEAREKEKKAQDQAEKNKKMIEENAKENSEEKTDGKTDEKPSEPEPSEPN